jgi:hypothetical protein
MEHRIGGCHSDNDAACGCESGCYGDEQLASLPKHDIDIDFEWRHVLCVEWSGWVYSYRNSGDEGKHAGCDGWNIYGDGDECIGMYVNGFDGSGDESYTDDCDHAIRADDVLCWWFGYIDCEWRNHLCVEYRCYDDCDCSFHFWCI